MTDTARNIRRVREAAGLTGKELAEKLNVTEKTVLEWETGRTEPDADERGALAKALASSAEDLITGKTVYQGRDERRFRRRALVFGCVTAALAIAAVIAGPYVRDYVSRTFIIWPRILTACVLLPSVYILGALCVMSVISALADIAIRNKRLKIVLLTLGGILSAACLYNILAVFFGFPVPPVRYWVNAYTIFEYPGLFAVPVCLIYLGAIKPRI